MEQKFRATLEPERKPVMAWTYAPQPTEGYVPPGLESVAAPPIQPTYMTVADPLYYIHPTADGVGTFVTPATNVRPYFPQQETPGVVPDVPVYVNPRPPPGASNHTSREDDHFSNPSEELPTRVKLLCSYGGKILPRPSDGKLRYVGGFTRMINVNRDMSYSSLMQKMAEVQQLTTAIKYQLPDEDLDALVSVSSDEDLENMMEEYDKLEAGETHPRLRVFLFTAFDYDTAGIADGLGDVKNSEQQYLEAVNGLSESLSRKQSEASSVHSVSNPVAQVYLPESGPVAVQVSQGVPIVAQYVQATTANGATVLPAVASAPAYQPYGYMDNQATPDTSLLKSDAVLDAKTIIGNAAGQLQYVAAVPVMESDLHDQASNIQPQVHDVQRRTVFVPYFQGYVDHPTVKPTSELQQTGESAASLWPEESPASTEDSIAKWSTSLASETKVHSDPSPGFHTVLSHGNYSVNKAPSMPEHLPISTYEYQAIGEKLNLQKPKESQESPPQQNKQVDQVVQLTRWDDRDSQGGKVENIFPEKLSGWATQMADVSVAHSSTTQVSPALEPAKTPEMQLPASLVNFLEDSLYAVRAEPLFTAANGYPHGSGSDSSSTTHMAHSGNSSNNMVLDLLTSDDVCCKTSCASTVSGGSSAGSMSNSSSHALEGCMHMASPVTKVLHDNQTEGPLISLTDEGAQDPFHLRLPTVAEDSGILREIAALSLVGPEFTFTRVEEAQQAAPVEPDRDRCDRSLDTSDLQTTTPVVTEIVSTGIEATLLDLADAEPERPAISAEESEAIARARGLQIIKHEDLEEIRELGSGTFGTVYHGKWRGTDVAIKRIKASCFFGPPSEQARLKEDFWSEACILAHLHHPNVVAFYGVVPDSPGSTLATVTEFMVNGSLKQVLHKKERLMDRRRRILIAMDAAFGMEYLHNKRIIHFDLKGENLLVNMRDPQRPICKVGDLGLSKIKHKTMVTGGVRGTLPWMAPELLNGKSISVSEKVDVFSFGIVMWELLTGEEPYAELHYGAIIGGIVSNALRPPVPSTCEPEWKSLMELCWADDPAMRPTFSEIVRELRAMKVQAQGQQQASSPQAQQSATQ